MAMSEEKKESALVSLFKIGLVGAIVFALLTIFDGKKSSPVERGMTQQEYEAWISQDPPGDGLLAGLPGHPTTEQLARATADEVIRLRIELEQVKVEVNKLIVAQHRR
jgi:hypothetical protein